MIAPLIGLVFAGLWLFVGAGAAPTPFDWILGLIGAALIVAVAVRVVRRGARPAAPFNRILYAIAVVAEVAAIALAQSWLLAYGRSKLLFPVVGVIVGVHFIGLWLAWGTPGSRRRLFLGTAAALVAINLAALLLPLPLAGRLALSGFGSAGTLLVTAAL